MTFLEILECGNQDLIKQTILERFSKNRAFFAERNKQLFEFLGRRAEEFAITVDDGGVNIINIKNHQTVYDCVDGKHQFVAASKIFAEDPYSPPNWKVHQNDLDIYAIDEKFWLTGKYADKIKGIFFRDSRFLVELFHLPANFLPSLSFFGLGGGLFIEYLLEKYSSISSFFIYEPNPDFFTISCYFVDYERLYGVSVFGNSMICVGGELPNSMAKDFFSTQKITAGFIRLELSVYEDEQIARAKKIFELAQNSCVRGWGTYEDEITGYKNQQKNIDLDNPSVAILSRPQKIDAPICVVGNGASLDGLLEFIKSNQDSMIILSCGTSIRTLLKNGIKPDFQLEIERMDYLSDVLTEAGYSADIPIIASNVINPKSLALANEPYIFFRDFTSGSYIKTPRVILHFGSPFVGNAGLNLAALFSDEIILCGIDVGYKAGSTIHSKDSMYEEECQLPADSVEVRPNFVDSVVYSNALYNLSKDNLERVIQYVKPKTVYNLSDGAYIEGAKAVRVSDLRAKPIKKSVKIKQIKKAFSKSSKDIFINNEKVDILASMHKIKQEIMGILNVDINNKRDMFVVFDKVAHKLDDYYESDMSAMLLLGGSTRHIIFNAFMAFIHIASDDIGELYRRFVPLIAEAMDACMADFASTGAKQNIAKLLKKII